MISPAKETFQAALRSRIKGSKKPLKVKRLKYLYPWATEKQYSQMIKKWLTPLHVMMMEYMKVQGETLLKGDSVSNMDAVPGRGFQLLSSTASGWIAQMFPENSTFNPSSIMMGLGPISDDVKKFADKQWGKQTKSLLGFEFQGNEIWWNDLQPAWKEQNFKLIKSVAEEYVEKVNLVAEKAVLNGWNYNALIDEMKKLGPEIYKDQNAAKRPGFIEYKSRLIARDQIGKINGLISQSEQQEVGLEMYTWDTAGDERVRGTPGGAFPKAVPSHYIMDGKLCRWDNAGVYSEDGGKTWIPRTGKMPQAHPGMEIQCRCVAAPYWDELL